MLPLTWWNKVITWLPKKLPSRTDVLMTGFEKFHRVGSCSTKVGTCKGNIGIDVNTSSKHLIIRQSSWEFQLRRMRCLRFPRSKRCHDNHRPELARTGNNHATCAAGLSTVRFIGRGAPRRLTGSYPSDGDVGGRAIAR